MLVFMFVIPKYSFIYLPNGKINSKFTIGKA